MVGLRMRGDGKRGGSRPGHGCKGFDHIGLTEGPIPEETIVAQDFLDVTTRLTDGGKRIVPLDTSRSCILGRQS
jgi:hypothetical protein